MSGRHLRSFLSDHKRQALNFTRNEEELLPKYLSGVLTAKSKKFRDVDYSQLLARAQEERTTGEERLRRVQLLSKRGQESRETGLLQCHREAWEREHARLRAAKKAAVTDLESWRAFRGLENLKDLLAELTEYDSTLYQEREQFEADTVDPIWSLRGDLKTWIRDRSNASLDGEVCQVILREIESVKLQQKRIQEILQSEYDMVWSEIKDYATRCLQSSDDEIDITRGIPAEAQELECPDPSLKASALREFQLLDDHFQSTLARWREQHNHFLSVEDGGWSKEDAVRFSIVLEQYPVSLPNRRALYIDRLIRELPHKTRAEIVHHETWHNAVTHYHVRREAYLQSWVQHRSELLSKVAAVFAESQRVLEARELVRADREQQQKYCQKLYEKVSKWRKEKLEALRIEVELAVRVREQEERRRLEDEEKKRAHREKLKGKLQAHHVGRERRHQLERESERQRLEEVRSQKRKEARHNKDRVQYRAEVQVEKMADQKEAEQQAFEEERDRQRRLELLRQQVQVNISTDPLRVLRDTKASLARADTHHKDQSLFPLYGYSDQVVTSDRRFKVAAALREAGLHDTHYARQVLASIPPPIPPRPDQESTLFK